MTLSIDSLEERLQDFVMRARAETGVPGIAIAASVGGRPVYATAGTIRGDEGAPFPIGAQFHLGCAAKLLLSLLALDLDANGRLSLTAPLDEYLPELRRSAAGRTIAVEHLLSHTSGYLGTHVADPATRALTWPQLTEWLAGAKLAFPPGRVFSYEHTESVLLAAVLRRITGRTCGELLHEGVFEPLALTPGTVEDSSARGSAGRHALDPRSGRFVALQGSAKVSAFWEPAFSNCTLSLVDLLTIGEAIIGLPTPAVRRWIRTQARARLMQPAVRLPQAAGGPLRELLPSGFGFGTAILRGGFFGNSGVTEGQCLGLRFAPAARLCVAAGMNAMAPYLRDFLLATLCTELAGSVAPPEAPAAPLPLGRCAGLYRGPGRGFVEARIAAERLVCTLGREGLAERLVAELTLDDAGALVLRSPSPHLSMAFFEPSGMDEVALMVGLSAYKRVQ